MRSITRYDLHREMNPKQHYPLKATQTKEHAFKILEWLLICVRESDDKKG